MAASASQDDFCNGFGIGMIITSVVLLLIFFTLIDPVITNAETRRVITGLHNNKLVITELPDGSLVLTDSKPFKD